MTPNTGPLPGTITERLEASQAALRAERERDRERPARPASRGGIRVPPGMTEVLDTEDDPAAQAERDRLMPQSCLTCGGEIPYDGAPPDHLNGCPAAHRCRVGCAHDPGDGHDPVTGIARNE